MEARVKVLEEQVKVVNHRINDLETETKSLRNLHTAILETNGCLKVLIEKIDNNIANTHSNTKRIEVMESLPRKQYDQVKLVCFTVILTTVLNLIVPFVFNK